MRLVLSIPLLVLATASIAAPVLNDAEIGYLYCLRANAARLDDGTSDARTIGAAIFDVCLHERKMGLIARHYLSEREANAILTHRRSEEIETATIVVLRARAGLAKPEQHRDNGPKGH